MIIEKAVEKIIASLKQDELVQAIFLKGSMARNEHDEYSDIDLYCLVDKVNLEKFLPRRLDHIRSYKDLLFYDDIYIIAPQIIAIFENFVHLDLFTVTLENYIAKDLITVLYDPQGRLNSVLPQHSLTVDNSELQDDWDDTVWFLYQYYFSAKRGNDLWSIQMLNQSIVHFTKLLLHIYCPKRAQLGMKTLERSLPKVPLNKLKNIYQHMNVEQHYQASRLLIDFVACEEATVIGFVPKPEKSLPLWRVMKNKWNLEE